MYCPINDAENKDCGCPSICDRFFTFALGLTLAIIIFIVGLILGINFATAFAAQLPILIIIAIVVFIIFTVSLLIKGNSRQSS